MNRCLSLCILGDSHGCTKGCAPEISRRGFGEPGGKDLSQRRKARKEEVSFPPLRALRLCERFLPLTGLVASGLAATWMRSVTKRNSISGEPCENLRDEFSDE